MTSWPLRLKASGHRPWCPSALAKVSEFQGKWLGGKENPKQRIHVDDRLWSSKSRCRYRSLGYPNDWDWRWWLTRQRQWMLSVETLNLDSNWACNENYNGERPGKEGSNTYYYRSIDTWHFYQPCWTFILRLKLSNWRSSGLLNFCFAASSRPSHLFTQTHQHHGRQRQQHRRPHSNILLPCFPNVHPFAFRLLKVSWLGPF